MPKEEHILCSMCVFVSSLLFLISWKSLLGNGYYIIYCRAYIKNQASISIKCSKANCRFGVFLHTFIESLDFTLSTRRLRFFVPQIFWYVKSFPCSWLSRKPKPENFHPAVGKVSISSNAASFLFPFLFFILQAYLVAKQLNLNCICLQPLFPKPCCFTDLRCWLSDEAADKFSFRWLLHVKPVWTQLFILLLFCDYVGVAEVTYSLCHFAVLPIRHTVLLENFLPTSHLVSIRRVHLICCFLENASWEHFVCRYWLALDAVCIWSLKSWPVFEYYRIN